MQKLSYLFRLLIGVTFVTAHNLLRRGGLSSMPLAFAVVEEPSKKTVDQQILDTLGGLQQRLQKVDDIEKAIAINKAGYDQITSTIADVQKQLLAFQKAQLAQRSAIQRANRPGQVSDACARHLGAIAIVLGAKIDKVKVTDGLNGVVKDILGVEIKAALSENEFALTQDMSSEVLELVAAFGFARRYGTVFPLGAASVKLPRLKTSPAFGLIGRSAAVAEKAPAIEWVTFTPSKWGGMIRLPSEIDEDSVVGLGQFIARYSAREMAKIEDVVFFLADGSNTYDSLKGLLKVVVDDGTIVELPAGKTKFSDVTLAAIGDMRSAVDSAVLSTSAYYFHPTFEPAFARFNVAGDKPYVSNGANGATLDGYPVRWVNTLPPFSRAAAPGKVFGLFGDPTYQYLGTRSGMRYDTSKEAAFETDETLIRALERFTTGNMAAAAVAGIKTPAA